MNEFVTDHRAWQVTFTLPKGKDKGRNYATNNQATVLAFTVQRAIEVLLERYPDAVVYAVTHRGHGEIIIADKDQLKP